MFVCVFYYIHLRRCWDSCSNIYSAQASASSRRFVSKCGLIKKRCVLYNIIVEPMPMAIIPTVVDAKFLMKLIWNDIKKEMLKKYHYIFIIIYYRTLCLLLLVRLQLLSGMFRCWCSPIWIRFCTLLWVAAKCKLRPKNQ